jgi:hypothetical protein
MTQKLKLLRKDGLVDQDETGPRIEHNVPIPRPKWRRSKWGPILECMEIGDSYLVIDGKNPRVTLNRYARERGQKFITRMMADGLRFWRVQ